MRVVLSVLLLAAAPTCALAQSKLELDYLQTSPAKAAAYSAIVPGGGFFHLASYSPKYEKYGYLYFVLGAASYAFFASQLKKDGMAVAMAGAGVVGIKLLEFGAVTDAAERERFHLLHKE